MRLVILFYYIRKASDVTKDNPTDTPSKGEKNEKVDPPKIKEEKNEEKGIPEHLAEGCR